jgi:hypothetical protein
MTELLAAGLRSAFRDIGAMGFVNNTVFRLL